MDQQSPSWPFLDPPNLAVITLKSILKGEAFIGFVTHDKDDGGWQFHPFGTNEPDEKEAAVVSLREITDIDPSILELATLPVGWCAFRSAPEQKWCMKIM